MKRCIILATLALVIGLNVHASDDRTGGYLNGRFWNQTPPDARIIYVAGLRDGLDRGIGQAVSYMKSIWKNYGQCSSPTATVNITEPVVKSEYLASLTYSDIVKALNKFYAEPENILIPIVEAQRIVIMTFDGESDREVKEATSYLRRAAINGKLE